MGVAMNFGMILNMRMYLAIILPISSALISCFPAPNFSPGSMMGGSSRKMPRGISGWSAAKFMLASAPMEWPPTTGRSSPRAWIKPARSATRWAVE